MACEDWKEYYRIREHPYIKNQKVKAILVTQENMQEVSDETKAFAVFNDHGTLLMKFLANGLLESNLQFVVPGFLF